MPQKLVAIKNFWELHDSHFKLADAIYNSMIGDAYPRSEIEKAIKESIEVEDMADMSESMYLPVLTELKAQEIEKRFSVKLQRRNVKPRPDVSDQLYELT